ncbi:MAG TPA: terminase gpA endonuclease subunit [Bryobacteraceae bacterium]|jgi:phage terminase large subunit GpA-like protein
MLSIDTLSGQWSSLWTPPARLPLSQWVEQHFHLTTDFATRNGLLRLYGWQREIFDAFTDPRTTEITCCVAIQLVKTLFIQAALAYAIAEDPGPVLLVEPKEQDAMAFSKKRLKPMIEASPLLRQIIRKDVKRDNTILSMDFPGGNFTAVSALVPGNLAGRTIRYLLCDETDKYEVSAGNAGDPISLAKGRTTNFGSLRKIVQVCSPTNEGESRIALAYDGSDQRKPWVPCPHCGQHQILKFDSVKWGEKLPPALRGSGDAVPGPTYYQCLHCEGFWNDLERRKACELVEWRADKPFKGHAGFWISHLYSPWNSLEDLASDFLIAKRNKETLKVFITERLAELWKEDGSVPDDQRLYARREEYGWGEDAVVPERGLFLVASVDVQENPPRLEASVMAYGREKECWLIDYQVIQAHADDRARTLLPVTAPELWKELDRRVLQRDYQHASGALMPVWLMAIDTGMRPQPVYSFALRHPQPLYNAAGGLSVPSHRSVVPVKGNDDPLKVISLISKEDAARKRQGVRIVSIGTPRCKTEIFDNLRYVKPDPDGKPVANCWHFPKVERTYFEGLCSERRVVRNNSEVVWQKINPRNEPLDLAVYCRAAASMVGIDRFKEHQWAELERRLKPIVQPDQDDSEPDAAPALKVPPPPQRPRRLAGFSLS